VGTYLFTRILSSGEDSRFKDIRQSPPKFAVAFFAQATWVSLCLLPILAINSLPASAFTALGGVVSITDIIGVLLYIGGMSFEITADRQKSKWSQEKSEKKHDEETKKELAELEKKYPGITERRKACEARRAEVKKHEMQLLKHRHDESWHGLQIPGKLKASEYGDRWRAAMLQETHQDAKMEALKQRLQAEGHL